MVQGEGSRTGSVRKKMTARIRRFETEIEFMEKNVKSAARKWMGKAT
jgi:hypothetical protein